MKKYKSIKIEESVLKKAEYYKTVFLKNNGKPQTHTYILNKALDTLETLLKGDDSK